MKHAVKRHSHAGALFICTGKKENVIHHSTHQLRANDTTDSLNDGLDTPLQVSHHEPAPVTICGLPDCDVFSPADRYAELFEAVQLSRIFSDSKTFVDCAPKIDPDRILACYRALSSRPDFDLKAFVSEHFDVPVVHESHYVADIHQAITEHIDGLWEILTRRPEQHPRQSSLLPLPKPYVVPGGRFGEVYYWDSYFTMLGLAASGRTDLLRAMADNFAFLIDHYGHIPNGNRTYYLSRSQPPLFAMMVELFEKHDLQLAERYFPQLLVEYQYWMKETSVVKPGEASRHVVKLSNGVVLSRYWDDRDTPREEAYFEDVQTARRSSRPASEVYRELRAGAESGWDFSSRWFGQADDIGSIRTTAILPIDLNAFMYQLETTLTRLAEKIGDLAMAGRFRDRAQQRRGAVDALLWDADSGTYRDYDWRLAKRGVLSAACVVPLFVGMASQEQATAVVNVLSEQLLFPGGIMTSLSDNQQQWDKPNGWAPLQWMAIAGLRRYGADALAETIATRWLTVVGDHYKQSGKLVEKYDISGAVDARGGGGEYPLQDGFGWTNGVVRQLLTLYPQHHVNQARAVTAAKSISASSNDRAIPGQFT
ncbi:alpha,alpha-trehalase TreF [Acerihabitans sp. TG2]|nr:alpha,alpha-trehalase TreF [Acerihabitans sp. TG2]MEA9391530.1 alpha,alpha-trehalase TreF [Acerihabitans sp. TG2]